MKYRPLPKSRKPLHKQRTRTTFSVHKVVSLLSELSTVGIFGVAVYAAFFSPFSEAIESQLRSALAVENSEKLALSEDLDMLRAQKDSLEKQTEEKSVELAQLKSLSQSTKEQLAKLELDKSYIQQQKIALQHEIIDLYTDRFLSERPFHWGDTKVP